MADLRVAYVERDQGTWSDQKTDLAGLAFEDGNGFTEPEFCNLKAQLQREFDWLDNVKTMFDAYKVPYDRSTAPDEVNLQSIGTAIEKSIEAHSGDSAFWAAFSVISEIFNAASFFPEESAIGALVDSVGSAYDLSSEFANSGGSPVADEFQSKVDDLSSQAASLYANVAAGLDNTRDIVINDYGRLSMLGPVSNAPPWLPASEQIEGFTTVLENSAKSWFVQQLLPIEYPVWIALPMLGGTPATPHDCQPHQNVDRFFVLPFRGAPPNAVVLNWPTGLSLGPGFIAAVHGDPTAFATSYHVPSAKLIDPFFTPISQGGLGIYQQRYMIRSVKGTVSCQPLV